MEFCEMTLEKRLSIDRRNRVNRKGQILSLRERIQLAKDVALGMDWLHGISHVIHKDLKSANILLEGGRAKISDFGFAQLRKGIQKDTELQGTPVYMAPEMLDRKAFDGFKTDVYAFAVIVWEILTSEIPFEEFTEFKPFRKAVVEEKMRPILPDDTPECIVLLLNRCWHEDPQSRPTFTEIAFRLDEALVEVTIDDPIANTFWKEHFLKPTQRLEEKIQWKTFRSILIKNCKLPGDLVDSVATLLCDTNELLSSLSTTVDMEIFNKVVHIWGRFFTKEGVESLREMSDYLKTPGCYDFSYTREVTHAKLAECKTGTYLVRLRDPNDSAHPGRPFTVSYVTDTNGERKINHKLIQHEPLSGVQDYVYNGHFKTLRALLEVDSALEQPLLAHDVDHLAKQVEKYLLSNEDQGEVIDPSATNYLEG